MVSSFICSKSLIPALRFQQEASPGKIVAAKAESSNLELLKKSFSHLHLVEGKMHG